MRRPQPVLMPWAAALAALLALCASPAVIAGPGVAPAATSSCLTSYSDLDPHIAMRLQNLGSKTTAALFTQDQVALLSLLGVIEGNTQAEAVIARVAPQFWPRDIPYRGRSLFTAWITPGGPEATEVSCTIPPLFNSRQVRVRPPRGFNNQPLGVAGYLFGDTHNAFAVFVLATYQEGFLRLHSFTGHRVLLNDRGAEHFEQAGRQVTGAPGPQDPLLGALFFTTAAKLAPNGPVVQFSWYDDLMKQAMALPAGLPTAKAPQVLTCGRQRVTLWGLYCHDAGPDLLLGTAFEVANLDETSARSAGSCVKRALLAAHPAVARYFHGMVWEAHVLPPDQEGGVLRLVDGW